MTYSKIKYQVESSGVATVSLDDPDTRNSLSNQMIDELIDALTQARDDKNVRCVVVTSTHEKVFSSGGNLKEFTAKLPVAEKSKDIERFVKLFKLPGELGKPSICAANGHVLAGSLGLALACDLVIAKEGAKFGAPEINVGVFPFMVMALIYRNVPRKKTNELLLLGELIDAVEAREFGLVNKVVAAEEFDTAVADWSQKLASKSPLLMQMGKNAMRGQQDLDLDSALKYLRSQLALAFGTEDIHEGVEAFFEKREPKWSGR